MFVTRLLSGIVLMAIIITFNVLGGIPLFVFVTAISLIGLYELYKTVKMEKTIPAFICYVAGILIDCFALPEFRDLLKGVKLNDQAVGTLVVLSAVLILVMTCYVFSFPKIKADQAFTLIFGLIYVVLFMLCIYMVRCTEDGKLTVWLIYICAWGSDTLAYCVGRLIGKHHLPKGFHELSPKKTIEGCFGGIFGAALIALIFAAVFFKGDELIRLPLICAAGSVVGQIGDLAASAIKRNHDIKDYGKLIPGHGGILDRFDSIIFIAPIVYLLVR